jgi:hypothetical protein
MKKFFVFFAIFTGLGLTKVPIIYIMGERKGSTMLSTRTDRMTLKQFLLHVDYSRACPDRINPVRWNAMITWAKKRGYIS